jgi:hypothetical protein
LSGSKTKAPGFAGGYLLILGAAGAIAFLDPLIMGNKASRGGATWLVWFVVIACFIAGGDAMRRFARSADEVRKRSGAQPIVLFRSFSDDHGLMVPGYYPGPSYFTRRKEPFERALIRILSRFGPFVAIGKPGERVPPFGAARSYEDEHIWQVRALELIRSCKLIVMLAGSGPGLKWELERIIDEGRYGKLLILMPPVSNPQRCVRLREFASSLVGTIWHDALSQAVGDDVISVELANEGVVTLVTAPGYRLDPFLFRDAVYLALYGLWKDRFFAKPQHGPPREHAPRLTRCG